MFTKLLTGKSRKVRPSFGDSICRTPLVIKNGIYCSLHLPPFSGASTCYNPNGVVVTQGIVHINMSPEIVRGKSTVRFKIHLVLLSVEKSAFHQQAADEPSREF